MESIVDGMSKGRKKGRGNLACVHAWMGWNDMI